MKHLVGNVVLPLLPDFDTGLAVLPGSMLPLTDSSVGDVLVAAAATDDGDGHANDDVVVVAWARVWNLQWFYYSKHS